MESIIKTIILIVVLGTIGFYYFLIEMFAFDFVETLKSLPWWMIVVSIVIVFIGFMQPSPWDE